MDTSGDYSIPPMEPGKIVYAEGDPEPDVESIGVALGLCCTALSGLSVADRFRLFKALREVIDERVGIETVKFNPFGGGS